MEQRGFFSRSAQRGSVHVKSETSSVGSDVVRTLPKLGMPGASAPSCRMKQIAHHAPPVAGDNCGDAMPVLEHNQKKRS